MTDIFNILANVLPESAGGWVGLVAALHGLAVAIVNLTPTPKDDEVLAKVYRGIEVVAGIFTARAKQ